MINCYFIHIKKVRNFIVFLFLSFISLFINGQSIPDTIQLEIQQLSKSEQVNYLSKLCWEKRESDAELSILYGKYALDIAVEIGDYHNISQINNYLGVGSLYYNYDIKTAMAYFETAFRAAQVGQDSVEIGFTFNNIGDVYLLSGNVALASAFADSSLKYFKALNFATGLAYTYINIGQIDRTRGNFNEALLNFERAIKLHEEKEIKQGISAANLEMAKTFLVMEQYDSALFYLSRTLAITNETKNKSYHANSLNIVGEVFYNKERYSEALTNFEAGLQLALERNSDFHVINNRIGIALVYSKTGRINDGLKQLNLAAEAANRLNIFNKTIEVKKAKVMFYENAGDYKKAFQCNKDLLNSYDSLMANLQFETLIEIQHKQRISTNLNEATQQLVIERANKIYLLVILILTSVLVIVTFLRYRYHRFVNRKLKELNEGKDKLFAIIAHDLRNPFISILQYVDILKQDDLSVEMKSKFINQLEVSTENTYTLLENLLNLSAFRTGKIDFNPQFFSLKELLADIEKVLNNQLITKELNLILDLTVDKIYADKKMVDVILRNLITNAIKYSNPNEKIIVKATIESHILNISVIDNGIGISSELREKMFNSELLASKPGTSGEEGTGIGLSLCQEFVKKHGGTIGVISTSGAGSEFIIRLPQTEDESN